MQSSDFLTAVGIGVSDLGRSADFYRGILGMQETQRFTLDDMEEIVLMHEGRSAVVLMHYTDGSRRNYRDNPVKLVFYIADPVALLERIRAAGLEITRELLPAPLVGGALIAMAKDPDGYVIEIIEAAAHHEKSATVTTTTQSTPADRPLPAGALRDDVEMFGRNN